MQDALSRYHQIQLHRQHRPPPGSPFSAAASAPPTADTKSTTPSSSISPGTPTLAHGYRVAPLDQQTTASAFYLANPTDNHQRPCREMGSPHAQRRIVGVWRYRRYPSRLGCLKRTNVGSADVAIRPILRTYRIGGAE